MPVDQFLSQVFPGSRRFFRVGFGPIWRPPLPPKKLCPTAKGLEVKKFIQDVCSRRGLNQDWVAAVLDQATYQPKIECLMTPKRTNAFPLTVEKLGIVYTPIECRSSSFDQ